MENNRKIEWRRPQVALILKIVFFPAYIFVWLFSGRYFNSENNGIVKFRNLDKRSKIIFSFRCLGMVAPIVVLARCIPISNGPEICTLVLAILFLWAYLSNPFPTKFRWI